MERLIDRFGRVHRSLRISVTDRCNIRCQYCMPDGPLRFLEKPQLLSYEEIAEFVDFIADFGVHRLRLTGGEPLVRLELHRLVRLLKANAKVESIALTTNAMLLSDQIADLSSAGLDQLNISLDTLSDATFQRLSRRDGLDRVFQGIEAAIAHGYSPRLNAVLMRGLNAEDAGDLVRFAADRGLVMRFIEFMPLDSDRAWDGTQLIRGEELRAQLAADFGPLELLPRTDPSRPSQDYRIVATGAIVGFIDSVTQPFCQACDRLRLTADGKLRNCLFGREEWDVRSLLRQPSSPRGLRETLLECVQRKYAGHGMGSPDFAPPERAMYQIGG
jgi:cyclic pyranopterin phosphate synthase